MSIPRVGEVIDHYRIDRVVGQGGMGVVFAATDLRLSRTVAIKVITGPLAQDPEFRRRFQEEAAVLARVNSPYVIGIIEHDEHDDLPFIVTQFVDGKELGAWIRDSGPLPARVALAVCAQVARGLGDAHRSGVIHRDIKPGNVLVVAPATPQMHAYLIDFGIARVDSTDSNTSIGMVAGTWAYIAPERSKGTPASPASDIYALGCLLWACLTGSTPYVGTDVEMAIAHAQSPIPQLPGGDPFSTELNGVLQRLLAKDPADRYPDGYAVQAALEHLARIAPDAPVERPAGTPAPSMADSTIIRSVEPPKKKRWRLAVAAVAVLALLGGGAVWAAVGAKDSDKDDTKDEKTPVEPGVAGDLTGDGIGDVAVMQVRDDTGDNLKMWTVPFERFEVGEPREGRAADGWPTLGDTDGDGATEVVYVAGPNSDGELGLTTIAADGEETTQVVTADYDHHASFGALSWLSDIDGDGRDDLVLYGVDDDRVAIDVAISTDDGFADPERYYIESGAADLDDAIHGDFDGDGTEEILLTESEEPPSAISHATLLRVDGDQLVADDVDLKVTGIGLKAGFVRWLVGDPDGDGADEIVIPSRYQTSVMVLDLVDDKLEKTIWWQERLGRKDKDELEARVVNYEWDAFAMSDIDGDGDDDIVHRMQPSETDAIEVRVYEAEGEDRTYLAPEERGSFMCLLDCEDRWYVFSNVP